MASSQRRRSALGWTGIVGGLIVAGLAVAAIAGINTTPVRGLLDPESAGPEGSRALVEVLRDRGVEVIVARDRDAAVRALSEQEATLALGDTAPLDDADLTDLRDTATGTVLLEPRTRDLRLLVDGSTSAGFADAAAAPECAVTEAEISGEITPGEMFEPGAGTDACYPVGTGFGLVAAGSDATRVVAVDATALFVNEHLATDGHAALALNLLGATGAVVWYLPSIGDGSIAAAPTLGELTPPWVTPAMLLLASAALAAALWRGRRFGPLVTENLPVTVRAAETTEGRARLYAAAGDPGHALDQLRREALVRIGRVLGLGGADAAAIADAAAARLDADRARVRGILLDDVPRSDRDLVEAADRLREIERAVIRTVRPERKTP
ncbi:DUF4350 domain-containing protein [Microbacterium radiodurans]|uniref:DUF4350 domain-containing protein n=1 Tax=Microbacterium radiodurans TaxID=661398 RepID=UPI001CC5FD13|nr:DUF4350 domain-containing protein [Microbacterium radiodurans]